MESPHNNTIDIPYRTRVGVEQLSASEKQQFVKDAIAEKDKFVTWSLSLSEKQKDSFLVNSVKYAPSKKMLVAALSTIGLANIGFGLAADKLGLKNDEIVDLWVATFGAPILEEMIFRSKKIPDFITWAGNQFGIKIRPDKARLTTAAIFTGAHVPLSGWNAIDVLSNATMAPFLQRMAHEKGLAASTAAHAIHNATIYGFRYLTKDNILQQVALVKGGDREAKTKLATYYIPMIFTALSLLGSHIAIGISGIKEVFEDHRIHDMLSSIRKGDPNNPVNPEQIDVLSKKLLAIPSTDGYKFQTGVELAYVNAVLTIPDILKDAMTPDDYARTQVHKMVTEVWKDPKTLPYRLEKANSYISEQIALRIS